MMSVAVVSSLPEVSSRDAMDVDPLAGSLSPREFVCLSPEHPHGIMPSNAMFVCSWMSWSWFQ